MTHRYRISQSGRFNDPDFRRAIVIIGVLAFGWVFDRLHPLLTGPVQANWAAAIPIIISAIGAIGNYVNGRKAAKGANALSDADKQLAAAHAQIMTQLSPYISAYYGRSVPLFDAAANRATALASGDRAQIMPRVANQQAAIGNKYGSIISASRELNPRSGASANYNADLLFRSGDEKQALVNNEVSGAYGTLAGLAGQAGQLGAAAGGTSISAGNGATGALAGAFNAQQAGAATSIANYNELVKNLMNIYDQGKGKGYWN